MLEKILYKFVCPKVSLIESSKTHIFYFCGVFLQPAWRALFKTSPSPHNNPFHLPCPLSPGRRQQKIRVTGGGRPSLISHHCIITCVTGWGGAPLSSPHHCIITHCARIKVSLGTICSCLLLHSFWLFIKIFCELFLSPSIQPVAGGNRV